MSRTRIANMVVPTIRQVVSGAAVSIVLKADQRTGREVQGVVRDVLTRGDHHRGIKVRLTDGRIGRVQRMDVGGGGGGGGPGSSSNSIVLPAVEGDVGGEQQVLPAVGDASRSRGQHPRYRDVRLDDHLEAPPEQLDLGAYIVAPKKKGKNRGPRRAENAEPSDRAGGGAAVAAEASSPVADVSTATITCPVCNAFEGDEAAVAHHVSEHFD